MKVGGKLEYYNQDLMNILSESNFEGTLKNIRVAFEDCEDDIVGLVIDLEEENELKHKRRMDDLNRKLDNLRNAVSEYEKVSRIRRTQPNNDPMHPEPVTPAFSEDNQQDITSTKATKSVANPCLPKETLKHDKKSSISQHSYSIQDSTTNHTAKHNVALSPEYMHENDDVCIIFDETFEQNKAEETDRINENDTHVVHAGRDVNGAHSATISQEPLADLRETVPPEIHIERHTSTQPEDSEEECTIIDLTLEGDEHHEPIEDVESVEEVIFFNSDAEQQVEVATISPQSKCHKIIEPEPGPVSKCIKRGYPSMFTDLELSIDPNPENTNAKSDTISDGKSTYPVPSPPEYSDDGMQSNTNNIDKNSSDQSMLNTLPASQAVLEEVNSSSPTILRGCQTRKTCLHEDGKGRRH